MTAPVGFTGVDWAKRSPERLCADLMSGGGPAGLVDCALAWGEMAEDLDQLVIATRRTIEALRNEWDSAGAVAAIGALSPLPAWLRELTSRVQRQHSLVCDAATAVESARIAMPAASAIDGARSRLVEILAAGPAAVMAGGLSRADRAGQELAATAAAVMVDYERHSEPTATAATQSHRPPVLVRSVDHSSRGVAATTSSGAAARQSTLTGVPLIAPRVLGNFSPVSMNSPPPPPPRAPVSTQGPDTRNGDPSDSRRGTSVGPMAPLGMTQGAVRGAASPPMSTNHDAAGPMVASSPTGVPSAAPMTWAQLATDEALRVATSSATTDAEHTAV